MASKRFSTICQHISQSKVSLPNKPYSQACAADSNQQHQDNLPVITAEPRVALYDEKIIIKLNNFPRNEKITLHGEHVQGKKKVVFASCGHYVTNEMGQVSIAEQPSTGGTYTGLEPMGIIWSLQPGPGQPQFTRMLMQTTDVPSITFLRVYKGHLQLEDIYTSRSPLESIADHKLERWLRYPSEVTRIEVHAGNVRGVLFLPSGDGPFQGVIDMFGSAGGILEYRAALLASHGFAVLSLPFFRYKDLPKNLAKVTFDYFEEAVNWFSSHPKVFPNGIGVVAVSKGTEFAYCMSAYMKQVKCVVAINGIPYISIFDLYHKGKCLIKGSKSDFALTDMSKDGELIIADCVPFKNNLIPSWQGDAKHLILVSEDDYQLNIDSYKILLDSCPEEKKCNFDVVRYPGAGHLLEPPYNALCRTAINPAYQLLLLFGGKKTEHAHAQEDSWQRIIHHLRQHIPMS